MCRRKAVRTTRGKTDQRARWRADTSLRYTHRMATSKRRSANDGKRTMTKKKPAMDAVKEAANNAVQANAAADNANRYRRSGSTLYVFKLPA